MRAIPLRDRLLVKRKKADVKTEGGLFLPETAKEVPLEGTVIATGSGRVDETGRVIKLEVQAGDTVLFSKYAGIEITLEKEEYLVLREEDIQLRIV